MIDTTIKDLIIETARIEEVVGDFVTLTKKGREYEGLCPFHDEKTPSFKVNAKKNIFKCFGCGASGDAIAFIMQHQKIEFPAALTYLGNRYNIKIEDGKRIKNTYEFATRPATETEKEGDYVFNVMPEISEAGLKTLFAKGAMDSNTPDKLRKVCAELNCFQLQSYTKIGKDKNTGALMAWTFTATATYHIFMFDHTTWKKILQPNHEDKARRFFYHGDYPKDHINGKDRCTRAFDKGAKDYHQDQKAKADADKEVDSPPNPPKLKAIIKCSGERDALNVAALGYQVVWMNSESAKLTNDKFKELQKMCDSFYNLGDIDTTGKQQMHSFAMFYLEAKTIRLPDELLLKKDFRGNPCKDVRDYLAHYKAGDFHQLLKVAYPYQFWEKRVSAKFNKIDYSINNTYLYNFLQHQGFYRYASKHRKDGKTYVQVTGNIVREVQHDAMSDHIIKFFNDRHMDVEIKNAFYRSPQTSEQSLNNLPYIEIDFTDYDAHTQYYHFKNCSIEITAAGIKLHQPRILHK